MKLIQVCNVAFCKRNYFTGSNGILTARVWILLKFIQIELMEYMHEWNVMSSNKPGLPVNEQFFCDIFFMWEITVEIM